jgi:hypothetical protein
VNKPFKDNLKQLYALRLLAGDHILTPTGKIKKPSVALLCGKTSWQRICSEVTVKGFKKCCVSNIMDRRDDDIFWKDDEEVETVVSESDEVGLDNNESGEVRNNDSGGDEVGNCGDSETNW